MLINKNTNAGIDARIQKSFDLLIIISGIAKSVPVAVIKSYCLGPFFVWARMANAPNSIMQNIKYKTSRCIDSTLNNKDGLLMPSDVRKNNPKVSVIARGAIRY